MQIYDYEYQGNYASVKFKDGYWGIVNKNGKVILDGADYIEKLPTVTALCSAVKNGHVIIQRNKFLNKSDITNAWPEGTPCYDTYSG